MTQHVVLRVVAKLLIPYILLFALYVQFHGDYGPGGGFQAGVIFARRRSSSTRWSSACDAARRVAPPAVVRDRWSPLGVLIYAGVGVVDACCWAASSSTTACSPHDPVHGQHLGILLVELGVGITVAAVMISIFFAFAGREPRAMSTLLGLYNYWIVIVLMMTGFYIVIARGNLVKKVIGLNIFQTSVFLLYITHGQGQRRHRADPRSRASSVYSNPLPSVLILTAIVVGVATTAVALALVVRIQRGLRHDRGGRDPRAWTRSADGRSTCPSCRSSSRCSRRRSACCCAAAGRRCGLALAATLDRRSPSPCRCCVRVLRPRRDHATPWAAGPRRGASSTASTR